MESVHNKRWPAIHGKVLKGSFVSDEEASEIEEGKSGASTAKVLLGGALNDMRKRKAEEKAAQKAALKAKIAEEKKKKKEEMMKKKEELELRASKNTSALSSLFRKTQFEPSLYWLPNSEEVVAAARKEKEESAAAAAAAAAATAAAALKAEQSSTTSTTATLEELAGMAQQQPQQPIIDHRPLTDIVEL
eukprot:TRINITY_DN2928_c0_g1_i6.p2 TRINITY_DN2928_c0_g1~~TRINITY_DN2928_c0_g1_i6.p2  ORF type:complete len:190 (+),score=96.54 TRINITY_DN2928_c0_g1_i6:114-683(+)